MKKLVALIFGLAMLIGIPGFAETPKDTLVIADALDNIVTLDPAEIYEFLGAEYAANTYDRLIGYDIDQVSKIYGVIAESWKISADGKTYLFTIRKGVQFASGNPLTAEDVEFSLRRTILLEKSPAFILGQFGINKTNVNDRIKALDLYTVQLQIEKAYAPTFLLYCLTATIGSVVDKKEVLAHEENNDLGYNWLRNHYAGSGPFEFKTWKPSELMMLERNENYWGEKPKLKRVIIRHVNESATQRLLLEKGDIDLARELNPGDMKGVATHPDIKMIKKPKGAVYYLGLNQKNKYLSIPQVRQAFKYLVDYQGIGATIVDGQATIHQSFLPAGFLGALDDMPFTYDVAKAKALLKEAGLEKGFKVAIDVRNTEPETSIALAIQSSLAKANIELEIIQGESKQTLTKYRSRMHDVFIGRWGPDYMDPHTNADTFARNPDNSDEGKSKTLAWRNAWDIPQLTAMTDAAVLESDSNKRIQLYQEIQRSHQATSPFVIMFQEIEVAAMRKNVNGFILGPSFDTNFYRYTTK